MDVRVRMVNRCKIYLFTQYYLSPRYFLVVYSIEKLPRAILATGVVNQAYDSLGAILFSIRCPL